MKSNFSKSLLLVAALLVQSLWVTPQPAAAIYGGSLSTSGSVVALVKHEGGSLTSRMFCSGVLVHPSYVLTAQHCVRDINASMYKVVIGRARVDRAGEGQTRSVANVYRMPGYDRQSLDSDLALLRLSSPSTMPTIPLAGPDVVGAWNVGADIRAYGYGRTSATGSMSLLQRDAVFRINTFTPSPAGGGPAYRPHEKVTATWTGRQLCKGDSGGPWTRLTPKGRRVVGISSDTYSYSCDGKRGGIAMKVGFRGTVKNSPGYYWVTRCMANNATCGTYPR